MVGELTIREGVALEIQFRADGSINAMVKLWGKPVFTSSALGQRAMEEIADSMLSRGRAQETDALKQVI